MSFCAPFFSNQSMLGAISAQIFREFLKVFRDFARILWDFARIFTKSKLLGVRLHPLHPRLLHQRAILQTKLHKNKHRYLTVIGRTSQVLNIVQRIPVTIT